MKRWVVAGFLLLACATAYAPFVPLPLISDDYLQIGYGRIYVPPAGWDGLAADALYRCRATSLLLTHAVDRLAGPDPAAHRVASILVHWLNCLLIALLGRWQRIGYRVSLPAAFAFAVMMGHEEAVVWSAALHELVLFAFILLACIAWFHYLQSRGLIPATGAVAFFLLALASKEPGVLLPVLFFLLWWIEDGSSRWPPLAAGFCAVVALLYTASIFAARQTHLHLNDGTFSWDAPFAVTLLRGVVTLLLPFGFLALPLAGRKLALGCLAFGTLALMPYAFLTSADSIPSRHTYLASLALAMLVGAALAALPRRWAVTAAILFALVNCGYLWTVKLGQYRQRAAATEEFLRFSARAGAPVAIACAPYRTEVFQFAAWITLGWPRSQVLEARGGPSQAREFCWK